jgi:hypothetical protein
VLQLKNDKASYDKVDLALVRRSSYYEEWFMYLTDQRYDLLLEDWSLFQFRLLRRRESFEVHYGYYECAADVVPYDQFLRKHYNMTVATDEFLDIYEDYVYTQPAKPYVTPIRYDFEPDFYREARHPAAHIHFGRNNDTRIRAERVWYPVSFVLFVLRQVYPEIWEPAVRNSPYLRDVCRNVRARLPLVDVAFKLPLDHHEVTIE